MAPVVLKLMLHTAPVVSQLDGAVRLINRAPAVVNQVEATLPMSKPALSAPKLMNRDTLASLFQTRAAKVPTWLAWPRSIELNALAESCGAVMMAPASWLMVVPVRNNWLAMPVMSSGPTMRNGFWLVLYWL